MTRRASRLGSRAVGPGRGVPTRQHSGDMTRRRTATVTGSAVGVLVLLLGACGDGTSDTARPDAPTSGDAAASTPELITPGGVAALVQEHLGEERVEQLAVTQSGDESVGVMVRLADAGPADNFAVSIYSPEGSDVPGRRSCRQERRARDSAQKLTCVELDDGRTVMASLVPEGFSDDNTDGVVVYGTTTSDTGAVIAMYESYDRTPPVTPEDLVDLLRDPRLAWRTDPEVNRAGADIELGGGG